MSASASFGLLRSQTLKPAEARVLRGVFAVLALMVAITALVAFDGFGGHTMVRVVRDGLASAVYILVAGLATWRAVREPADRRAWTLFAFGLTLYGVGNLLWIFWLNYVKNPPIPSVSDGLWLALYPLSYAGIITLSRVSGEARAPGRLWLDGIITGTGLAGLGAAVVFRPVLNSAGGGPLSVATELAYPVGDLLLAAVIVGVLALRGWRLDRRWALLTAGFLMLAVADCMYAVQVAEGSTNTPAIDNFFFFSGMVLLALAAWQVAPDESQGKIPRWVTLLLPAGFALVALGLLVYDHFIRLDPLAFSLAIITVLAAIVRMALAFKDVRNLVEARHQAATDDLTSLANRRTFAERARSAIGAAEVAGGHLSVLILDLDNFKELNEALGHDAGDSLLRRVGPCLGRVLRQTDTIARLGGDEFGILLDPLDDEEAAARVAQKLLRALSEPFEVQGLRMPLTASIGIASFPHHARDAAELIRRADVAMYLAKAGHCGYAFYAPERDTKSRERLVLAGELAASLEAGGIEVHYQPKGEASTRRIVGVEALVRWRRPDGSLMLPGQFIPAAEQAGLSRALTRAVLEKALNQARIWREQGRDLHVAVNTTVADLLDADFPGEIARALSDRELPPESLVLEVTESSVLSDPIRIGHVLARLGELGIDLSLDDFGTGYSSLAHLRSLPVREVKVDRSFVSWMCSDQTDAAIVYATIQLAHKLGMRVVAEGVEDAATWRVLDELGCELIQGYSLGRPVPAPELELLLDSTPAGAR